MSRTRPTAIELEQLTFTCTRCGAVPQGWCLTRSGDWAPLLHGSRWEAWRIRQDAREAQRRAGGPR